MSSKRIFCFQQILLWDRLHGRPRETREYSRGTQIPLNLLEGIGNTFSAFGDISEVGSSNDIPIDLTTLFDDLLNISKRIKSIIHILLELLCPQENIPRGALENFLNSVLNL